MKKNLTVLAWTASVMLVLCMVFAGCKDNKKKSKADKDDDETELAEDMDDDEDMYESEDQNGHTFDVRNAREFLLALKDDAHINVIVSEPLQLTPALNVLIDEGEVSPYMVDGVAQTAPGLYWMPEYDGNTLYIVGLENITIEGTSGDKGFLMTTPRYSDVLRFEQCRNITIKNMILGHEEAGDCEGDVLVLRGCKNVTVEKCDLFGCGCIGIYCSKSQNITVSRSDIYGCSMRGLEIFDTKNMSFKNCSIYNNAGGIYLDEKSRNISLSDCNLYDNRGQLFMCYSELQVKGSQVEHHCGDESDNVTFTNCDVVMDYRDTDDLPDVEPDYYE